MLGTVAGYSKTQSIKGFADFLLRTPAVAVSRLLLVVISVLYPAAAYLGVHVGLSVEACNNYFNFLYVTSGQLMKAKQFGKVLESGTHTIFHIPLGLRDMRQLMDTVVKEVLKKNFDEVRDAEEMLDDIEGSFGHKADIAKQHYSLDFSAHARIAPSDIESQQAVSIGWHRFLGLRLDSMAYDNSVTATVSEDRLTHFILPV